MNENEFNNDLANMSEIFNNKTFRYRINGFAHACNMNDVAVVQNAGVLFASSSNSDVCNYFITVNEKESCYGKSITLNGLYNDLNFTFINQCDNKNLDKRIIDLPFYISLTKRVDEETYIFMIESDDAKRTKFIISKSSEFKDRSLHDQVVFYANVMNFSKILKIVKTFVYNPKLCFNTYNEIMQQQKIVFTNSMLDKMAMQDYNLDKPVGKIKKLINKVMGE